MNDERLEGGAQAQAAEWVRALPEETPGMAWRAALNEKVRAEAERRARRRWRLSVALPGLGFAAAAALALALFVPRGVAPLAPKAGRIEASLVALHEQTVQSADIVGSGLSPADASPTASSRFVDPLEDLDTL